MPSSVRSPSSTARQILKQQSHLPPNTPLYNAGKEQTNPQSSTRPHHTIPAIPTPILSHHLTFSFGTTCVKAPAIPHTISAGWTASMFPLSTRSGVRTDNFPRRQIRDGRQSRWLNDVAAFAEEECDGLIDEIERKAEM